MFNVYFDTVLVYSSLNFLDCVEHAKTAGLNVTATVQENGLIIFKMVKFDNVIYSAA